MLKWRFSQDGAENAIYVVIVRPIWTRTARSNSVLPQRFRRRVRTMLPVEMWTRVDVLPFNGFASIERVLLVGRMCGDGSFKHILTFDPRYARMALLDKRRQALWMPDCGFFV